IEHVVGRAALQVDGRGRVRVVKRDRKARLPGRSVARRAEIGEGGDALAAVLAPRTHAQRQSQSRDDGRSPPTSGGPPPGQAEHLRSCCGHSAFGRTRPRVAPGDAGREISTMTRLRAASGPRRFRGSCRARVRAEIMPSFPRPLRLESFKLQLAPLAAATLLLVLGGCPAPADDGKAASKAGPSKTAPTQQAPAEVEPPPTQPASDDSCCRFCFVGTPCGDECLPEGKSCDKPEGEGCACDESKRPPQEFRK